MTIRIKIATKPNSDGLINCLPQTGQLHHDTKISVRKFITAFQFSYTTTYPSSGTKSIGLPADALVPCFLLAIWTISS